jgi:hypothetical protein
LTARPTTIGDVTKPTHGPTMREDPTAFHLESTVMTDTVSGAALTVIGIILVVLGILVAGNIQLVLVGLGSLVAAELFATLRVRRA